MYQHKVVNIDEGIKKLQLNKIMHKEGRELLEENLINKFNLKREDLIYKYSKEGKPYLINSPLYFSVSHCNNIVICIISDKKVGIDIEDVKNFNKYAFIKALTKNEKELLYKANNKNEYFFRIWTLKESFLKAIEKGLSYGMKNVEFNIKNNIITCSKQNFVFKQEKLRIGNMEYIVSITWEGTNE